MSDPERSGTPEKHLSFQLGMEDSEERLNELQFSLVHHASGITGGPASIEQQEMIAEGVIDINPRQEQEMIAAEISAYSQEHQGRMPSADDEMAMVCDEDEEEDIGILMGVQRVDSREVVFENRQKKAKILSHYVMGDVLGEGSYAKVKEAIDQHTLCRRAIKIMKKKKLKRIPHGEENVAKEIKLLGTLDHPNVMKLVEVFVNDEKGKIYLVLEYCCAVLKEMLESSELKRFPTWQAHFYFVQLIEGLEYLHSHRIVHKDIKPGNLLLATDGNLKIADFGTAEILDTFAPDDNCHTSQGTPAFQPPEIANGAETFPGFKVDVWSSGVTLFHFVTGDYPFSGDTIFRLFEDIAKCEYTIPTSLVDPVLESLIRGMLTADPQERFSVLNIKSHDWFRKNHPQNCPPVTVLLKDDDPALSTSVIPYLADLHYGSGYVHANVESSSQQFITEHEMNERERKIVDDDDDTAEANGGMKNGTKKKKDSTLKEKTVKCLNVRKVSDCKLS